MDYDETHTKQWWVTHAPSALLLDPLVAANALVNWNPLDMITKQVVIDQVLAGIPVVQTPVPLIGEPHSSYTQEPPAGYWPKSGETDYDWPSFWSTADVPPWPQSEAPDEDMQIGFEQLDDPQGYVMRKFQESCKQAFTKYIGLPQSDLTFGLFNAHLLEEAHRLGLQQCNIKSEKVDSEMRYTITAVHPANAEHISVTVNIGLS